MATLDPPLDLLRRQILDATELSLGEIGWIAGASHRQSGPHFPEYPPPPGNPPYEVDAIDPPHDPSRGADMAALTEALRLSRDPRIKLVIFNRRIFSSYDHAEGPPFTWRPYYGENPHTGHAHIERTDTRRDDLRPWQIGIGMALDAADKEWLTGQFEAIWRANAGSRANPVPVLTRINQIHTAVGGVQASVDGVLAAVNALDADGDISQDELNALADALAAKLPGDLAVRLANALTIRFTPTAQ